MKRILATAFVTAALFSSGCATAQPAATQPISAQPTVMAMHVRVADMARSERFYRDVFGMNVTNPVSAREHVLRFPDTPNTATAVILLLNEGAAPSNGGFLLQVPDIDAAFARVEAAGGAIGRAPRAAAGAPVRSGFITDPDGTRIELMQFISR